MWPVSGFRGHPAVLHRPEMSVAPSRAARLLSSDTVDQVVHDYGDLWLWCKLSLKPSDDVAGVARIKR
jgi:hypothetical protein